MATSRTSKCLPPGVPEFAVDRETITRFFSPPIARSTFYDLVTRGLIRRVKGIRGYYRLNDTLMRLGLSPVTALPVKRTRSRACLLRWAFWMLDPLLFSSPQWAMDAHRDPDDEWIASLLAQLHEPHLSALKTAEEKLAYAEIALRVQTVLPGASPT